MLPTSVRAQLVAAVMLLGTPVAADPNDDDRRPQIQADLGLAVVGAAYEHPLDDHHAIAVGAQLFSTYFAPWFGIGDKVLGGGIELRFTRFLARGFYATPFVRSARVGGERDGASGTAFGFSAGAFIGRSFSIGNRVDVRIGIGAQYIRYRVETSAGRVGVLSPFVALDLMIGYRL